MNAQPIYVKQRGRLSLWRYRENSRNYSGWNITADPAGCASLLAICDELSSGRSQYRTLTIFKPTTEILQIPNNREGRATYFSPDRLRLAIKSDSADSCGIDFDSASNQLILTLDVAGLKGFQTLVESLMEGKSDERVHVAGEAFWLWRFPQ